MKFPPVEIRKIDKESFYLEYTGYKAYCYEEDGDYTGIIETASPRLYFGMGGRSIITEFHAKTVEELKENFKTALREHIQKKLRDGADG